MALFGKKKEDEKKIERPSAERPAADVDARLTPVPVGPVSAFQRQVNFGSGKLGSGTLKGFYISEKATGLAPLSQYVFKVFGNTTKNEIKKQVERSFGVEVRGVKVINLPQKARRIGRHTGFKPGFKKAIVVLEKGYSIDQAKV